MSIPLICFDEVTKSYAGPLGWHRSTVFSQASMSIGEREIVGLYGPSGCGKSTLLRMFFGLTDWQGGRISYRGCDLATAPVRRLRRIHQEVQIVFQDPRNAFNPRWLVRRSLAEPFRLFRLPGDPWVLVGEKLGLVGLEEGLLDRYPHQLSGGQLQRLALARCLMVSPGCLFLDEATSMLDLSVQAQIMGVIRDLHTNQGVSVLLVSHDRELIEAVSQRVYRFQGGRLAEVQ